MEDQKEEVMMADRDVDVSEYLRQICTAARQLAHSEESGDGDARMDIDRDEKDNDDDNNSNLSCDDLIDLIARTLLAACHPEILSQGVSHLPSLNIFGFDEARDTIRDDIMEQHPGYYQHRRTDYLRRLLRLMAPVSMEVCATVLSTVLSQTKSSSTQQQHQSLPIAAILLLSHWLAAAPHLMPMAIEFLRLLEDPWQHAAAAATNSDQQTQFFLRDDRITMLLTESVFELCLFFRKRREMESIRKLQWDWSFVFEMLHADETDATMSDASSPVVPASTTHTGYDIPTAIRWYAVRTLSTLMDWTDAVSTLVTEKWNLEDDDVLWRIHPWEIDQEELLVERSFFTQQSALWDNQDASVVIPSTLQTHSVLRPLPYLARVGGVGLTFFRDGSFRNIFESGIKIDYDANRRRESTKPGRSLVHTPTTQRNLSFLGAAMCQDPHPPPILICGPLGSGKSSLVREFLRLCRPSETLMEFHIDEETDSKTLIGSYTTSDIPGEFVWRPGALTHAVRNGSWILIEDLDSVPVEIQAALVKLLEERLLPIGNGRYERCHPSFQIFATCTTSDRSSELSKEGNHGRCLRLKSRRGGGKHVLNTSYWRKVHVQSQTYDELRQIAGTLYPDVPTSIVDSSLRVFSALNEHGVHEELHRSSNDPCNTMDAPRILALWNEGRNPTVRDFFKLLSRISIGLSFEKDTCFTTERQRTICMAESIDVFVGSCSNRGMKEAFIRSVAAPSWKIAPELAIKYHNDRCPTLVNDASFVEIGRVRIDMPRSTNVPQDSTRTFAQTNHSLRFMESLAACVRQIEPVLLVGETGGGKTSLIQHLAQHCGRTLIVQNLSLQTDSTDLLGGYRPLEMKNVARRVYNDFIETFVSTFSRKQNEKFLQFAASMMEKANWKRLSQCFQKASRLGLDRMKLGRDSDDPILESNNAGAWNSFSEKADRFEKQRVSCDAGLAFEFSEGALVDAVQSGKWVLLDEINLASSDTLQRLCGLLEEPRGSLTLLERGDTTPIVRHPNFRLFAAMNPATDAGKKDLPPSIRARFSEFYVEELLDPIELRIIAAGYLRCVLPSEGKSPEHTDIVISVVSLYLKCRSMGESSLSDGNGHKPKYTLRTLSRTLSAATSLVLTQRIPLKRAIFEGFRLAFEGILDPVSTRIMTKMLSTTLLSGQNKADLDHPGKRPGRKCDGGNYVLIKPFWIAAGPLEPVDWCEAGKDGMARFILTPSVLANLRRLSCTLAAGPWPILLEGPTSSGKTTIVEYIAARCGHHVVRINNHEHTDVQEYTGSFAADQNGLLSFRDGILVQALRQGHWVILDELNLAPSEVLEALNRLLDDNRELYLAETNETIKPHPHFRLFATQNPSGVYGGRKPLSRAFRNRFVELHVDDIPTDEMITILEKRCGCPPSHAKMLVKIMLDLRHRRSMKNVFLGKDSFITPRDLLRWAERHSGTKQDLAEHGYMLLAERLRSEDEKHMVREVLEEHTNVTVDLDTLYYGDDSRARKLLESAIRTAEKEGNHLVAAVAPTRSILRLIHLVLNCIQKKEPVLLVGETGCGKTLVVQLLSFVLGKRLNCVNCHATTETSDLIGGLRPVRGRGTIKEHMILKVRALVEMFQSFSTISPDAELEKYLSFDQSSCDLDQYDVDSMLQVTRGLVSVHTKDVPASDELEAHIPKRRKLQETDSPGRIDEVAPAGKKAFLEVASEIEELGRRLKALFEWHDGPLVEAMKRGELMLLDEMSLAEDAVLERLNSVLEPSRLLVLAEKGDSGSVDANRMSDDRIIHAHDDFRCFATMNPGGDFGKRELSPALRSRFTEIWVPSVAGMKDFEIVVNRYMFLNLDQEMVPERSSLINQMLKYIDWFNVSVCGDPTSPFSGYGLSLRDVLSWTRFIVESQKPGKEFKVWDSFYHGACLMHLDGLGLGSGVSPEASADVKVAAEKFLLQALGDHHVSNLLGADQPFRVQDGQFGAFPYVIATGSSAIAESSFEMNSPTTSLNVFRILRAMQVRKPILLEGAPGVGKTSLVTAIAAAAGHELVRINLSEQTDMSDLMGNDLPSEDSSASGPVFEWRDGVLLTAIKEGTWVLLDELNLASQSVLEGLNSCLDHRGTIYVPELGRSFDCPSTFRIFGAQNPLGQGGGRKGLPKSFLNRFTKVFVDPLSDFDFRSILASRFGTLSTTVMDNIISFNCRVQKDVEELREYGTNGGPWEFNLRDVFRWSELVTTGTSNEVEAARDLYLQRFRNSVDRDRVDKTFREHFGVSMASSAPPMMNMSTSLLTIGDTPLSRLLSDGTECPNGKGFDRKSVLFANLLPLQAVARCIRMRWPCLLVGGCSTGKSSIISCLAKACNTTVVEQSLSPSSDVTELLGVFEQVETYREESQLVETACELAHRIMEEDSFVTRNLQPCFSLVQRLQSCSSSSLQNNRERLSLAYELSVLLLNATGDEIPLRHYTRQASRLKERLFGILSSSSDTSRQPENSGHFIWRDGILVEAMTMGYWLVLENVNLCPASVLDRLNSVTEPNGTLLLSESGALDCSIGQSHRIITPHENFRIFLTMDPAHGEISRAMRNRCVEVALSENMIKESPEGSTSVQKSDMLGQLRGAGVRSLETASKFIRDFTQEISQSRESGQEPPSTQSFLDCSRLFSALSSRGVNCSDLYKLLFQLSYELGSERASLPGENEDVVPALNPTTPLPEHEGVIPVVSDLDVWHRRLLRSFSALGIEDEITVHLFGKLGFLKLSEIPKSKVQSSFDGSIAHYETIGRHLGQEFTHSRLMCALTLEQPSTTRIKSRMSSMLFWVTATLGRTSLYRENRIKPRDPLFGKIALQQAARYFEEKLHFESLLNLKLLPGRLNSMTVLQASLYFNAGILDESTVQCTVTRLIHPFIAAVDAWINELDVSEIDNDGFLATSLDALVDERNGLWDVAKYLTFDPTVDGPAAFESSEFVVQWKWLRKQMAIYVKCSKMPGFPCTIQLLVNEIERVALGGLRSRELLSKIGRRTMTPLTPKTSSHWLSSMALEAIARAISLDDNHRAASSGKRCTNISLQSLVTQKHPSLFVPLSEKINILAALSTLQFSWWDGVATENHWIEGIDFGKRISSSFVDLKNRFAVDLARAKIDSEIQTVDNQVEAAILDDFSAFSESTATNVEAYRSLKSSLFETFGKIQAFPLAEYWCAWKEDEICGSLSSILLGPDDDQFVQARLALLVPDLEVLLETGVAMTSWSVSDFRSHQLLLWMATGSKATRPNSLWSMIRSLMPIIQAVRLNHSIFGARANTNNISTPMEMPDLFVDDESPLPHEYEEVVPLNTNLGSGRLWQSVRSDFMLGFVGEQLSNFSGGNPIIFYTIENATFRRRQSTMLLKLLSSYDVVPTKGRLYLFHFTLLDILEAARNSFKNDDMSPILNAIADPQLLANGRVEDILEAGDNVKNPLFDVMWQDLLRPLLKTLWTLWNSETSSPEFVHLSSVVSIFVGLLRLNVLVPSSPLDPGKAPLAKASLVTKKLNSLTTKRASKVLYSELTFGKVHPEELLVLEERKHFLSERRKCLMKKVIERVEHIKPYYALFIQMNAFLTNAARTNLIVELVEKSQNKELFHREFLPRVENWLSTADGFCESLSKDFVGYEDVTTSILESVRMMQDGFLGLVTEPYSSNDLQHCCRALYKFPMNTQSTSLERVHKTCERLLKGKGSRSESACFSSISMAVYAQLCLKKSIFQMNNDDIRTCFDIVNNLLGLFDIECNTHDTLALTVEEAQEVAFREQFPDHKKDFETALLEESDASVTNSDPKDLNRIKGGEALRLSDEQGDLLFRMFNCIFCNSSEFQTDNLRKMAFHLAYTAAGELKSHFRDECRMSMIKEPLEGHVFALCLSSAPKTQTSMVYSYFSESNNIPDFQSDPCPALALEASAPLDYLIARCSQLLTAFPGHTVLVGLLKVCEKVVKLNLMTTPMGKLTTGMEFLLRQAQEWEQHASEKVKIGPPLAQIAQLVVSWRRLELQSWTRLLESRRMRRIKRARRHWARLHSVLLDNFSDNTPQSDQLLDTYLTPSWVWKGLDRVKGGLSSPLVDVQTSDVKDLLKLLDTFVLTSPLGEFHQRLAILKCSSSELLERYKILGGATTWKLQQARVLCSVWNYYNQFSDFLNDKMENLKKPLEDKLKNETKLAKWDVQSYYALADSTERNQRKLMKILSEFDDVLDLNVGMLIQEHSCFGLRKSSDRYDDSCTSFPSNSSMFPFDVASAPKTHDKESIEVIGKFLLFDEKLLTALLKSNHLEKLETYYRRMKAMQSTPGESLALIGANEASSFCQQIFDRIDSLRNKSTRPMKERALVDLLRALKDNDFKTTKWSTPRELISMEHLFLLPIPEPFGDGNCPEVIQKGEQYFQKCIAEVHSLSSETTLLGSSHMTRRQIELMVNLSQNTTFMITQQRCVLCKLGKDMLRLQDVVKSIPLPEQTPALYQSSLKGQLEKWKKKLEIARESLHQVALLAGSVVDLTERDEGKGRPRDVIARLNSARSMMPQSREPLFFISSMFIQELKEDANSLDTIRETIEECKEECEIINFLPKGSFDDVLEHLNDTVEAGRFLKEVNQDNGALADDVEYDDECPAFLKTLSAVVKETLITYQNLSSLLTKTESRNTAATSEKDEEHSDVGCSIGALHKQFSQLLARVNLKRLYSHVTSSLESFERLSNSQGVSRDRHVLCWELMSNTRILLTNLLDLSKRIFKDAGLFFLSSSKASYIVTRIFRNLVAKGFCSDQAVESDQDEGDVSGMTFGDDNDGTGMGEGEGTKDVSEQIENEDQLAGLQPDRNDEESSDKVESKQLNEEEANQGMEMEGDFDGDLHDMPDPSADNHEEDGDGEEELEREMGDDTNADEQVVDEKMWEDSDDENDRKEEKEKFEQDAAVEGEAIEDAIRTKEDEEQRNQASEDGHPSKDDSTPLKDNTEDGIEGDDNEEHHDINDDLEELYEDNHGVDVRGDVDGKDDEKKDESEEEMRIDEEMKLDNEEDADDNSNAGSEKENLDGNEGDGDRHDEMLDEMTNNHDDEESETDDKHKVNTAEGEMNLDSKEDEPENDEVSDTAITTTDRQRRETDAHGVKSEEGTDAVTQEDEVDENPEDRDEGADSTGNPTGGATKQNQTESSGQDGDGFDSQINDGPDQKRETENSKNVPNPMKDPGDASRFWHQHLNIIDPAKPEDEYPAESDERNEATEQETVTGEFEFSSGQQESTQVLAEATEEEAIELESSSQEQRDQEGDGPDTDSEEKGKQHEKPNPLRNDSKRRSSRQDNKHLPKDDAESTTGEDRSMDLEQNQDDPDRDNLSDGCADEAEEGDDIVVGTKVVSDMSKLLVADKETHIFTEQQIEQDDYVAQVSLDEANEARSRWRVIQGDTQNLSRRLCEKVRLVMEPLVATKLRGDYRTGKRINMKRVIGYIASGYRKDKIWLRRTKPAKRDYRVLLAVDDSESMKKSGAGDMALRAMATVAVGMNQLEIGELGVASFGDDMKLVHPFHIPFTSESGVDVVRNFKFDQQRTRIALCIESAMSAFEEAGDRSSMQLVFLISDGRIERDSRSALKRLIREMTGKNILLAMIIVEGNQKKKDSILNMKEVTFDKGKPIVKRFIDDYPFPYYIVLDDVASLPEVLGDALKQWFEILTQLQSSGK